MIAACVAAGPGQAKENCKQIIELLKWSKDILPYMEQPFEIFPFAHKDSEGGVLGIDTAKGVLSPGSKGLPRVFCTT